MISSNHSQAITGSKRVISNMSSMQIDEDEVVPVETALTGNIVEVTMHPLVLLSAADHYHRVARGTRKRVVGVLLGSVSKGVVDCTNSFAVPFEEDSKNAVSCVCSSVDQIERSNLSFPVHTIVIGTIVIIPKP